MVRAGCAATTCALAPRSFVLNPSRWQHHRNAAPARHSFILRTCQRRGRRVSSSHHCDFLIDATAIRNARNSPETTTMTFSNRLKIASLRSYFALLASLLSNRFSPLLRALSNRESSKLEPSLTYRKQSPALRSNRQKTHSALVLFLALLYRATHAAAHDPFDRLEWRCHRASLTVACRSSKLLVSTGPAIRSSARAAINCEGEDRCRNALFSRMCGAAIKSTGFASA